MPVSALGDADPLVEVEAAVVDAVGDEHHLMGTAIGENDEITGLCRALQADLVFGGRQLVGLLPEGKGVGIHMALHRRLIYRHAYNSSPGGRDPRRPSGADGADNVSSGEARGSGTTTEQDGAAQGDEEPAGDAANEALAATWLEVATGAPGQGDIAQMHQADDGGLNISYEQKLERSGCTQVSELSGCDINKSKAENAAAGFGAAPAAASASPYAGNWVATFPETGATVANIRIDDKDQVWVNDKQVSARKSDGALVFSALLLLMSQPLSSLTWVQPERSSFCS